MFKKLKELFKRKKKEPELVRPMIIEKHPRIETLYVKTKIPYSEYESICKRNYEVFDSIIISDLTERLAEELGKYMKVEMDFDPKWMEYIFCGRIKIVMEEE